MHKVYLGIGSNLGDRRLNIDKAISKLSASKDIKVKKVSSIYETEPVGGPVGQGKYLNGAVEIETTLKPIDLLKVCKDIEAKLGRVNLVKDAPRPIDLDILFYDDLIFESAELKIPHPRMNERLFVLNGLMELAPDKIHPLLKKKISDLYKDLV